MVCSGKEIMGKPTNNEDALRMLLTLSGKGHRVTSGVNICWNEDNRIKEAAFTESTTVFFHDWSEDILRAYVNTGESMDKAGAYAIQGKGAFLIDSIDGSWTNVVGLPVSSLLQKLVRLDLLKAGS